MAGWRVARPERRPLGRPGDLPHGFGASAGVPSSGQQRRKGPPDAIRGEPVGDRGAVPRAVGDRRPRHGRGGAGCRRRRSARSSGRPARDGAGAAWSSRATACRSGGCAPGRSGGRRRARARRGPALAGPAHQSQSTCGWYGPGRQSADLDQDDGPAHDRARLPGAARRVRLLLGVQAGPGADTDAAVLVVLDRQLGGRRRPGRGVVAVELGPVLPRSAAQRRAAGHRRIGVEAAPERSRTSIATGRSATPWVNCTEL